LTERDVSGKRKRGVEEPSKMKIGYFVKTYVLEDRHGKPMYSGGIKVVSQHVKMLNQMGYETCLVTRNTKEDLDLAAMNLYESPIVASPGDDLPDCDLYVGTFLSDVKMLFDGFKGPVVHLCQGYEPIDYRSRITGEAVTARYQRRGRLSAIRRYADRVKFRKKIRGIESIYALPTVKAAVSRHLVELLGQRYRQRCFLIQNGVDPDIFYPDRNRVWGENGKIKILSVGPMQVGFKGIPDTLEAIRALKGKGLDVDFIRVSSQPPSGEEKDENLVDTFYMNLKEREMAELYRHSDLFISSSLDGEGFGLPAMEALASGVPSILTEIASYVNFDERRDFAYFVPTHQPDKIVEGILTLRNDAGLREKYRERGIRVSKGFTLERTKRDLLSLIKELLDGRP